jgi:hypothetical protein
MPSVAKQTQDDAKVAAALKKAAAKKATITIVAPPNITDIQRYKVF